MNNIEKEKRLSSINCKFVRVSVRLHALLRLLPPRMLRELAESQQRLVRSQVVAAACERPRLRDPAYSGTSESSFLHGIHLLLDESGKLLQRSLGCKDLDADTVANDLVGLEESLEIRVNNFGESELPGDEDGLSAGELELRATESLLGKRNKFGLGADGDQDGSNVHTGGLEEGLSVSVTHTGLESISTGARKHLVDADNVPCVDSDANMEGILGGLDLHVLVSSDTGSFESFGRNLLLFTANQMDASGESIPLCLLCTTVIHSEFWVRYTTVEAGLRVWLVFLVSVATCGSSSHFILII